VSFYRCCWTAVLSCVCDSFWFRLQAAAAAAAAGVSCCD